MSASEFVKVDFTSTKGRRLVDAGALGRVVCRRYPPEDVTKGGLIVPDKSQVHPPGVAWITDADDDAQKAGIRVGDTIYVPGYIADNADMPGMGDDLFYLNRVGEAVFHWPQESTDEKPV